MATELSGEFKQAFGRMLVGLKMQYSIPNALNYSQTLYEYTRGGLYVMDKMDKYEDIFASAEKYYLEALRNLQIRGRDYIVQQKILICCFHINKLIFPIALKEKILVMNEEMFGVLDPFLTGGDQPQEGRRGGKVNR